MTRTSTVYVLHFSEPYKHAKHYMGGAVDLDARLAEHGAGHGARLTQVVKDAGITWTLARTWQGGRMRERQLKNRGGASRCCPTCKAQRVRSPEAPKFTLAEVNRDLYGR